MTRRIRQRPAWPALASIFVAAMLVGAGIAHAGLVTNPGVPDAEKNPLSLVYEFPIPVNSPGWNSNPVAYSVDNSAAIPAGSFSRVAYYLEFERPDSSLDWVYASFDAAGFTDDATKLGVPNTASGEYYNFANTTISNMNIYSNVAGITTGTGIATGNIEFWPSNYGGGNDYGVPGANGGNFDFGDGGSNTSAGHGSMQIHNYGAGQTLFAYNAWGGARTSELGLGTQVGGSGNPDWTFNTSNISTYAARTLEIHVLSPAGMTWDGTVNDWGSPHWTGPNPPPPPDFPDATIKAEVGSGKVTVEANHAAMSLAITGGEVEIGAGNTLTVAGAIDATGGVVTMGPGATLSAAGGSIAQVDTNGDSAFATTGRLLIAGIDDQGITGTLTKTGTGQLDITNAAGGSRLGDTALAVDEGELIVRGAGALGDTATLSGGTLTILPGVTAAGTADDLRERYYSGDGPGNISPLAPGLGYLGQTPVYDDLFSTGSARMTALGRHTWLDLDQGNPGGGVPDDFYDRTGGTADPPVRNQDPNNLGAVWSGSLIVGAPGSGAALEAGPITLATASDDGSTWWVDGQLVLDNNQYQGRHEQTATLTLSPGAHEIYVGWYEGSGGANMAAKIGQGSGLSYNSAAMKFIDPTDPAQAGMWTSEAVATLPDLTGLTVSVDAPGSAFNVLTAGSVDVGGLELHNSGEVAVGSALSGVNFASIRTIGGGDVALTTNVPVSTPDYSDDGTATHFVKRGSSVLTLDNSAGVASGEATHFEVAEGTLRAIGDNVLGGATQATLSGGTLDIVGGETVIHDVLAARRYNYANEGYLNDIQSTLLATSPDGQALLSGPLKFDDDGQFASLISGPNDNYMFLFTGQFTAPTDGTYSFRRDWDDDRGVFYVDANQDGAFQSGEKFGNAAWGGQSQSFTLAGGESYGVAIGHLEWGGGSRMDAFYTAPGSGEARIQPGAQPGLWSTVSVAAIDAAGLDLGVTANSTLRASSDADAEFGALTFHNGAVLTTEGAPTGFASTAIAGGPGRSGGIDNTNDVHIGTYDDGGVASTLVKRGSGAMRVENTTPGSIAGGSTSFRIEGGTLTATGDDLLGGAPMVTLAGGTLELCPPTTMPDGAAAYYSFDTVSGTIVFNGGSASGKDGTLLNGAGITSAGMVGSGMTIRDGSSDRLDVPGGVDIGNEWTIATWFNNLHGADNWRTLTRGASADHQIIVENGSNRLGMYDNAGGGNYMPVSPQADLLPGDGWHHLAAVGRADATTAYYLDGALVGTIARRSTSEVSWIGNGDTGWGQSFADVLDEFFVYNRALGQSEVQDLYAAGLAGGYGAPLDMTGTGITVVANSTLKVVGPPSAAFGSLSFQGGTLDIQTPTFGVTFASGAVDGAATSFGVNNTVDVTVDGPYDGGSATVAFTKAGPGALTLAQGATNHGGISVQVGGGRLVTGGPMAAANLNIGSSGNMETGANDVTISDGGQFSAGSLKITGSGAAFAIGGDDLAAAPERLTLGGGTVTFSSGGMPTGLQLWLDASALTGLSDGATVTRWFDNSGMGHDADNVNSDPSYVASGPNGAPVVHFDGDDWMYTSHNFDSLDAHTIIAVSRYTDSDHERLISSRNHNWLFGYHGNKDERWYAEGWIHDTGTGNTDWHIHAGTMSGGTNPAAAFWKDSALLTANDTGSNDTNYKPGQLELGGWNGNSETSTGDVGEVLIFDRVLTSSELNDLGGYLASKYGIAAPNYTGTVAALPINLPTTDLFVAATSTLFADNESTATFGDLVVPGGATLTLAGAPLGFSFDAVSGAGTIDGSLTVRSGLAPGDSAGTLTVAGGLTVVDGLVYEWELGATDSDLIFVGGTLGFEGRWVLRVLDAGGEAYASDRLYLFAGPGVASLGDYEIDLSGAPDWLGWTDPAALRIDIDGNGMYLTGLTAIPEPATISLLGLGALWLVRRRRRAA